MSKPRPTTYVVQTSKKPFAGKAFRVVGYNKEGKRKQYWFATEDAAEADARDRNFQLASHGSSLEMTTLDRARATLGKRPRSRAAWIHGAISGRRPGGDVVPARCRRSIYFFFLWCFFLAFLVLKVTSWP